MGGMHREGPGRARCRVAGASRGPPDADQPDATAGRRRTANAPTRNQVYADERMCELLDHVSGEQELLQ